jgi:hypothetical protein
MKIFEVEFIAEDINAVYHCTDQTSIRETYLVRNFYDSAFIPGYAPNTDIKIADILYASVNSQQSPTNFDKIIQNIWITINFNYEKKNGLLSFQYTVANSEFGPLPTTSLVTSQAGIFDKISNLQVITRANPENPDRILLTFYV